MTYNAKDYLAQVGLKSIGFNPGALDGLWGGKSELAYAAWQDSTMPANKPVAVPGGLDERSERNIATLVPKAQAMAREFMAAILPILAKHGMVAVITSGLRTYAEQTALYAQGRTEPGPIVTNAPAGYSNHNFGDAFDITLFRNGKPVWDSPLYLDCAKIGRDMGLDCGAFFKSIVDEPHYQVKSPYTLAEKRERKAKGIPIV